MPAQRGVQFFSDQGTVAVCFVLVVLYPCRCSFLLFLVHSWESIVLKRRNTRRPLPPEKKKKTHTVFPLDQACQKPTTKDISRNPKTTMQETHSSDTLSRSRHSLCQDFLENGFVYRCFGFDVSVSRGLLVFLPCAGLFQYMCFN